MNTSILVFMPVYNRSGYLEESISSILDQTFDDFILLVIDDGSTDDSFKRISRFEDSRIICLRNKKNIGIPKTYNRMIDFIKENINTKYIAYMDSDDISAKSRLEVQYKYMNDHRQIGVCGTQGKYFGGRDDKCLKPTDINNLKCMFYRGSPFINTSVLLKSDIFKEYNFRYNESLIISSDVDFFFRLKNTFSFANVPESLVFVRDHDKRITHDSKAIFKFVHTRIIKLFLEELGIDTNPLKLDIHESFSRSIMDNRFSLLDYATARDELVKANKINHVYDYTTFKKYTDNLWASLSHNLKSAPLKECINFIRYTKRPTRMILKNTILSR